MQQLKWQHPDEEGLVKFMCGVQQLSDHQFKRRIRADCAEIRKTWTVEGRFDNSPAIANIRKRTAPMRHVSGKKAKAKNTDNRTASEIALKSEQAKKKLIDDKKEKNAKAHSDLFPTSKTLLGNGHET